MAATSFCLTRAGLVNLSPQRPGYRPAASIQPMKESKRLRAIIADEEGITAIEYGLVAALISVFIMVAIGAVGDGVVALFDLANQSIPN